MSIKDQLKEQMKAAMRAKEKQRLGVIRMIQAEFKRVEVDERIEVSDERALIILDKMSKQRRDSIKQYEEAARQDLADIEKTELTVIAEFLPAALSEAELLELVEQAIAESGAENMQAMGKVMGLLKPQVQGRADMGEVSKLIKAKLS